jgi:hypothetical protein
LDGLATLRWYGCEVLKGEELVSRDHSWLKAITAVKG